MGFYNVLRDDKGMFIEVKVVKWNDAFLPREAEATAIKEALSCLKDRNFDNVQVEIDSLQVVRSSSHKHECATQKTKLKLKKQIIGSSTVQTPSIPHPLLHTHYCPRLPLTPRTRQRESLRANFRSETARLINLRYCTMHRPLNLPDSPPTELSETRYRKAAC
nr:uncharacterized protein LOC109189292 [Ipomoea batatas]